MALTPEFISAVSAGNLLRVRIMLKDSLLVDKRFYQFKEMRTYAEGRGVNFWMEKTEELEIAPKEEWNLDLMNLELTRLVNDFTKERLVYCQGLIEKVYGITPYPAQSYAQQPTSTPARNVQQTYVNQQYSQPHPLRTMSGNSADYDNIIRGASAINRILRGNKSPEGNRIWWDNDIEAILAAAKKISAACENIKSRRG